MDICVRESTYRYFSFYLDEKKDLRSRCKNDREEADVDEREASVGSE